MNRTLLIGGFLLSLACNNNITENNSAADTTKVAVAAKEPADTTAVAFWTGFQQALQEKNEHKLITLTHFPLPGITPFLDADKPVLPAGADTAQFIAALPVILNKALRNQALITPWDSLWIITPVDFEQQITGGQILLPVIDPGTNLHLCYAQWAIDNGKETNQALVFGKVKGVYKLCGITWKGGIY